MGKTEFLRLDGAGALVDAEMQHGIGGACVQAAATGLADADLLGQRPVRFELKLGENAGEIDARSKFRRQDVDFEAKRAEACFNAEMPRRQPAIARALIVPVGFLRGGDKARVARVFQLFGQPIGHFVHFPQHEHVDVLHRDIALAAECAGRNTLHQHDHALAIRRNALGCLWPARIGREGI